jgi:hypothetical protein
MGRHTESRQSAAVIWRAMVLKLTCEGCAREAQSGLEVGVVPMVIVLGWSDPRGYGEGSRKQREGNMVVQLTGGKRRPDRTGCKARGPGENRADVEVAPRHRFVGGTEASFCRRHRDLGAAPGFGIAHSGQKAAREVSPRRPEGGGKGGLRCGRP